MSSPRSLSGTTLGARRVAGAMSGNARCTQSGCQTNACTADVMGCGGDGTMNCTGASDMWCPTQMGGCG